MTNIPDLIKATEGATEGPWKWGAGYRTLTGGVSHVLKYEPYEGLFVDRWSEQGKKSAALIAAAPTFRAEVIRLMEENERLRKLVAAAYREGCIDGALDGRE